MTLHEETAAMNKTMIKVPLMLLAMASLIAGLLAALYKLEWLETRGFSDFPSYHGALMVSGFLGTLISLERAIVLGALWGYCAPFFAGLGTVGILLGLPAVWSASLFASASLVYCAVSMSFLKRISNAAVWLLILSSFLWIAGNLTWMLRGWSFAVVLWWIGFLLLTIAGERFELTHVVLSKNSAKVTVSFFFGVTLFLAGATLSACGIDLGTRAAWAAMALLGLWLLRYDMAVVKLRQQGLQRFMAVCLVSGYVWLAFSGVIGLVFVPTVSGRLYDAGLHAFFLGFVMSMIFAHPVLK